MIYIYIYLQCFLNVFSKKFSKITGKTFIYVILPLILCFFYMNGVDWRVYQQLHENWLDGIQFFEIFSLDIPIEKGYMMLSFIFKDIISYEVFNGLILMSCYYIIISKMRRYSKNIYVSLSLYLTLFLIANFMEPAIRQIIAITIILLGLEYIEKRRIIKYFTMVLTASLFHQSVFILLPLYFFNTVRLSKKYVLIFFISVMLIIRNLEIIVRGIAVYITVFQKYLIYFENQYSLKLERSLLGTSVVFIQCLIYIIIIFKCYSKEKENKIYMHNAAIIAVILTWISSEIAILYRVVDYFEFFLVCVISSVYSKTNKKRQILLIFVLLLNFSIFYKNSESAKHRFYPVTNYIVEFIRGNLYETLEDKISAKEKLIEKEKEMSENRIKN